MEQDVLFRVIEAIKIMQDPNIEKHLKEKVFKELCKTIIDTSPNYGVQTKIDLKTLVELSKSESELGALLFTYLNTHDGRN